MTSIVELSNGITTWAWLCPSCIKRRENVGWTVKVKREIGMGCDDCHDTEGDSSIVQFAKTPPEARLPTAEEYPREKPVDFWGKR